ncbi:MAG: DUF938 domain-containing protein [Alphaproteobacteria bacterium]|nr:DUF938 domain-containing protein [Alphaproteobacteria bacterium]
MTTDARISAPATERNREPILAVLARVLAPRGGAAGFAGDVLEIASGTGQHVAFFAARLPALSFQPSDPDAERRASIAAWVAEAGVGNVRAPLDLDVMHEPWPVAHPVAAILCINMIHISPWEATLALMRGAGRWLPPGAPLYVYGPFMREGRHTAPSNAAFDADLRGRDPRWGVRNLETVSEVAHAHGLSLDEVVEMPANNLSVVFRRIAR